MKPPAIPLEQILALGPACLRMTVPESYRDHNGHMNMRWYLGIYDDAGDTLHARIGLTREYHTKHATGTFDLEHHIHFLSEVNPGEDVAVYARLVAQSPKRLHYMMFMVDETTGKLASIFECMNTFADLKLRKTAPFPAEIASKISTIVASHSRLSWPAPVCGAMHV